MDDKKRLQIWLSRTISRKDAEQALKREPNGAYLVRASQSSPGDYVISVVCHNVIQHHQIKHNQGRMTTRSGKELGNLEELIEHYKRQKDGLEVLLTSGVKTWDPEEQPSYDRVNSSDRMSPKKKHDYVNAEAARNNSVSSASRKFHSYVNIANPLKLLESYEVSPARIGIRDEIGGGQFGTVYVATMEEEGKKKKKEPQLVAVKACKRTMTPKDNENFLLEAATLAKFNHENVLCLLGIVTRAEPWMIITQYMPYGDLRSVLRSCRYNDLVVQLEEKLAYASQIAAGMDHLASLKFVHRDLAARNILMGLNSTIKIADFGLSRHLDDEQEYYRVQSQCVLPVKWMAPECFNKRKFSVASDCFAFGVVIWEIMSLGRTPYKKVPTRLIKERYQQGERLAKPADCPDFVYAIMYQCWNENPMKRPQFGELKVNLQQLYEKHRKSKKLRDLGAIAQRQATVVEDDGKVVEYSRDQLKYIGDLGEGEFGQVLLMETYASTMGGKKRLVAVKKLKDDANRDETEAFSQELELLRDKNFRHKNVVALVGVCSQETPKLIITEYMSLGDLHDFLNVVAPSSSQPAQVTQGELVNMCEQVAAGAAYLASQGCVHRDLAARNCLVADGPIVKISDFGLGRILSENMYYKTEGGCLPIRWLSPEAVLFGKFTSQSDVWAYGVILYEVFTWGGRPYEHMSNMEVAAGLTSNSLQRLRVDSAPSIINDIMESCFDNNPDARPSFESLERRLKDFGATLGEDGDDCEGANVPDHADMGTAMKSGWLIKQGGGTRAFGKSNWKKRWFVLRRDGTMTYSKTNKKGAKPLGYIDIKTCSQVTSETPFDKTFGPDCCFTVVMPQRTYALVSDSKKECKSWLENLKSFL